MKTRSSNCPTRARTSRSHTPGNGKPAVGATAETWNEEPASDADPILLPWDKARKSVAYGVKGAEIVRRDVKRR